VVALELDKIFELGETLELETMLELDATLQLDMLLELHAMSDWLDLHLTK
jgi:hypothetical protein